MEPFKREVYPATGLSVVDPRTGYSDSQHTNILHVADWQNPARTITGADHITGGALSVADPRPGFTNAGALGVKRWDEPTGVIAGATNPTNGAFSVADPRPGWENRYGNLSVQSWEEPSKTVIAGGKGVQGGWLSVADPRRAAGPSGANFNNVFRIVKWSDASPAITGGGGPTAGGICVGDPRGSYSADTHKNVYRLVRRDEASQAISSGRGPSSGGMSVAAPRGIDGIDPGLEYGDDFRLPEPNEKCKVVIIARDGTYHRPFTTAELAILQSLMDSEDIFDLDGESDSAKRERIGNAVPSDAATAIASTMGQTLLMAWSGTTFALSSLPIWVKPVAAALAVKPQFEPHE